MPFTRIFAAATCGLAVGFVAAGVDWQAAGEEPARTKAGQAPVGSATPQVTATPQATGTPQTDAKPSAPPPAKAGGDDRQPGAVRKDGEPLKFFEIRDRARSVVYAIDCSGSMATRNSLDVAKRELRTSLSQLPPDVRFAVIFYNLKTRMLSDDQGHQGLMAATASNRERVQSQIEKVEADGGTDHMMALRAALALKPEVIFFLTDGDLLTNWDVDEILEEMGRPPKQGAADGLAAGLRSFFAGFRRPSEIQKTRIQVIEFGRGPEADQGIPLRRLAKSTDGSQVYLDVAKFPR